MIFCLFLSEYDFYLNIILTFKITKANECLYEKISLLVSADPTNTTYWVATAKGLLLVFSDHGGCLCSCMGVSTDDYYTMF